MVNGWALGHSARHTVRLKPSHSRSFVPQSAFHHRRSRRYNVL
uniref:Uncharacterized protein n=1 Tax=uncultured marine microorganism HF4000_005H07 TaxID=455506 RepID=B3T0D6_9ZZZZ|nr:hypothetical protein ALOHA_HF4000005H07ctg1g13 [uncultured marine microorganism HF4000_005H07]